MSAQDERRPPPRVASKRPGIAVALTAALVFPAAAIAEAPAASPQQAAKESELGAVRERIEGVRARIGQSMAARDELQDQLRAVELAAAETTRELRQADEALAAGEGRLAALTAERQLRERDLAGQRAALARLVRADYAHGRRDYLAVLLSQEDPSVVSRVLAYHRYAERARAERVGKVRAQLAGIAEVVTAVEREQASLRILQADKASAQRALGEQRQVRAEVLARLNDDIRASGAELDRLTANARQLEQVIEALREALPDVPDALERGRRFADRKGALPWPAAGRLRSGFGTPRRAGLTWQGVVIDAPAGTPVQAVHHGRVAFADWLRGFGLLVIVDHGDGFMTLYGQNQGLLRQVGDWVEAGEAVATVGDSGGSSRPGLYFEVRQQGTPLNPAHWCQGGAGSGLVNK